MFSLLEPPLFTRLKAAQRVLVAGAGGGFDVYAARPRRGGAGGRRHRHPHAGRRAPPRHARGGHGEPRQEATRDRPSIVNGSIAAAVRGDFGDVPITDRTRGSELFINPLMAMYFAVDMDALARRSLYLDRLEDTRTMREIAATIEVFRSEVPEVRAPRRFPH